MSKLPPMIVITGPTSVGKTNLSISLTKRINGEIISADSVQVYRKMNIGSAKITEEEKKGIPHHLIDVLDADEEFNVAVFKELACKAASDIYSRGKIPVLVGGTGFYIQAFLRDVDFTEEDSDFSYRNDLELLAESKGKEYIHDMLKEIDPVSFDVIPAGNLKRVIRALEFHKMHGFPISEHNSNEKQKECVYNCAYFCLNAPRETVYDRIDKRVDEMIDNGLVEEVKDLVAKYGLSRDNTSMQALGYKEIYDYLKDEISLEEAVYRIKRDTRHFAKRQITYFKREDVIWINKDEFDYDDERILDKMTEIIKDKGII